MDSASRDCSSFQSGSLNPLRLWFAEGLYSLHPQQLHPRPLHRRPRSLAFATAPSTLWSLRSATQDSRWPPPHLFTDLRRQQHTISAAIISEGPGFTRKPLKTVDFKRLIRWLQKIAKSRILSQKIGESGDFAVSLSRVLTT